MVIIVGNQKGGAGKSTLTLLLANYLTRSKNCKVTVLDMDYQQSIAQKFEKAKILENAEPYEVLAYSLSEFPEMEDTIKDNPKDIVLIDLPGKLDDDGLIKVFQAADIAVCPFSYDEFSFESTVPFALVLKKINPGVELLFIPNRIKANVKYEIKTEVNEQLNQIGTVTAIIPDRIDFQRANTFQTPLAVYANIAPVFSQIFQNYIQPPFMSEIKTLADQLRSRMAKPETAEKPAAAVKKKAAKPPEIPVIIDQLRAYDLTGHKTLVHGRFDAQTAQLLHHLKMATGIEVTRVLCFAVRQLLEAHPEIKTVIKEHLEKFEL